jgi:hypothetical protein
MYRIEGWRVQENVLMSKCTGSGSQIREPAVKNREMHLFTKGFLGVVSTLYVIRITLKKVIQKQLNNFQG